MGIPIVGDLIKGVIDRVGGVADQLIVDKDKKLQLQVELERLKISEASKAEDRLHQQMMGQIEINKVEAASSNVFVAGWRPAAGWVSVGGLAYATILEPLGSWAARVLFKYSGNFPEIDPTLLIFTLGGMLGIGTLRTIEKVQGVVNKEPEPSPPAAPQTRTDGIPVEQLNLDPKTGRVKGAPPWKR